MTKQGCPCGEVYPCDACSGGTRQPDAPATEGDTLLAAAVILRREAEKDSSRSQNDAAELRIAAAVCEGMVTRV